VDKYPLKSSYKAFAIQQNVKEAAFLTLGRWIDMNKPTELKSG